MALLTDSVTSTVERALTGVAQRQRVTADNVANMATPGFRARRVDFERDLARAIATGNPRQARIHVRPSTEAPGIDGNNVRLEDETAILVKSGLQYDSLVAALNFKLGLLRTAIGGR